MFDFYHKEQEEQKELSAEELSFFLKSRAFLVLKKLINAELAKLRNKRDSVQSEFELNRILSCIDSLEELKILPLKIFLDFSEQENIQNLETNNIFNN